ncbi:MAG: LamG domain-containing protein [Fibromonadaceae bacterium]|jgi:hypothetical protein|nr:LamG domain-containing protein [Fibromonadaceae bacterium]
MVIKTAMSGVKQILLGICCFLLVFVTNGHTQPMEPARSTLFILLDGMAPNSQGIAGENSDPCKSYETSSIWGSTGFAKYLQEDITNSKAMIYSRAYRRPADSPIEISNDFADPAAMDSFVACKATKRAVPYYNAASNQLSYAHTAGTMKTNNILKEALEQWFDEQLVESEIQANISLSLSSSLQKQRNAWDGKTPKINVAAVAPNIDRRLKMWVLSWKQEKGTLPTLNDLQNERPDLIPSRYIVIANGMGGLVAREYIQSFAYKGEIDKVVFINTPHEGTGFADQLLFSHNFGLDAIIDVALAIPFAILASLSPIGDIADGEISSFLNSVVLSQVLKTVSGITTGAINDARSDYSVYNPALWYLAQDADRRDMKYRNLIGFWNLDESQTQVNKYIGALQYLNSVGMATDHMDPRYRIIYSYGMPTLGNSRRVSLDYLVQKKSHITQEIFNNAFSKMISDHISNEFSRAAAKYLDTFGVTAISEEFIAKWINDIKLGIIEIDFPGESRLHNFLDSAIQELSANSIAEKGFEKGLDLAVKKGIALSVQAIVNKANINIEELDPIVVNFVAATEYLIPTQYSAQVMSSVLPKLSPKPKGMELSNERAAEGTNFLANTMSNVPLNFFDQGSFDVPAYSAYGANVSLFSSPNADVKRSGYSLNELDYYEYREVNLYADLLENIGVNKMDLDNLNAIIFWFCLAQPVQTWKDVCKVAKLTAHYAYLINQGMSVGTAVTSMFGALDDTKKLAFQATVTKEKTTSFKNISPNSSGTITYKDIDALLFENPHISLQSVHGNIGGSYKSIPLLLFAASGDPVSVPEISSLADLQNVYTVPAPDSLPGKVVPLAVDLTSLQDVNYFSSNWYRNLTVKNVLNDPSGVSRLVRRSLTPAFTTNEYIKEFRFQIDDLRPDQLWQIKLDFNALTQIALERDGLYSWRGYIRVSGGPWSDLGLLSRPPVDENGLFVFRPEEFLSQTGKNNIPLAVLSQLQQDGPNVMSVMLVNRIGLQSNQQFSFYFTATAPFIREGWPNALQFVSSLEQVHISMSNLGNPYDADNASVRLIRIGDDANTEVMGFVAATITEIPSDPEAWETKWKIQSDLGNIIESLELSDGEYILQWRVATVSRTESKQVSWYTMNTTIFIDTKAPELLLHVPKKSLTGLESDGTWATLEVPATSPDKVLREVKTFLSYAKSDGSLDTISLRSYENFGSSVLGIFWPLPTKSLPEGPVTLHAHATDYAEPNANETFVISEIWIDRTAPVFDPLQAEVVALKDPDAPILPHPEWNGKHDPKRITLNAHQLLKLSIDIQKPLFQRTVAPVSIQITLHDSVQSISQTYARTIDVAESSLFEFIEPSVQKLADGIYNISILLMDEAGNSSGDIDLLQTIIVDRHAPLILSVLAEEPVYSASSGVDSAFAYISQSADYALNRSDLQCYQRLIVPGSAGVWTLLNAPDTLSKTGVDKAQYSYSMRNLVGNSPNGRWSTQFGCFDAVGNFGFGSDVFGVGNRYPQITYPTSKTVRVFDTDKIQIQGVAPNPVIPYGNEQTSEYKLEWRKAGDTNWMASGVSLTSDNVSTLNRNLAVWDRTSLAAGKYELRLSVRGCTDVTNTVCDWVSDTQIINLDDVDFAVIAKKPTIAISTPTHQIPGDAAQTISARLIGLADASKWSMDMKIMVSDPWDTTQKVTALAAHFDSVAMSPFFGIPAGTVLNGFSIWQAADGEWTIKWKGSAQSKNAGIAPSISLGYAQGSIEFEASVPVHITDEESMPMPSVSFGPIQTVSYDRMRTWNLNESPTQEFTLRFKTSKPFMVDLHTIDGAEQNQYWGAQRQNYASLGLESFKIPYIYVNPESYAANLSWNGLTRTGLYPGAPYAKVLLIATENREGGHVVTAESEWGLALGAVKIVSDDVGPGQFIVSKVLTEAGIDSLNRLGNIGYQFGIIGQAAKVTAVVKNSKGVIVKTLMNEVPVLAGSQRNSQSVQWDGTSDIGFAITDPDNYEIVVTAKDFSGNIDTRTYPFVMKFAGGLLPAPAEEPGATGIFASLSMDEAFADSLGYLRFIGKPDYLMKADITARTLPKNQRMFSYQWDLTGTQQPAFYRANRFSLGVRRARDRFPVTVVILMATQGRNFDFWCNPNALRVAYRMQVKKVYFSKTQDGVYWDSNLKLDSGQDIVAYDSYGSGTRYPIKVAVQVFPEFAYDHIKRDAETFNNREEFNGTPNISWSDFWSIDKNKEIKPWFNNWEQPLFWSTEIDFRENSGSLAQLGETLNSNTCIPSGDLSETDSFVCGAENPEQESEENLRQTLNSFNPHQDMLRLELSHASGTAYGTGKQTYCSSNEGSKTNVEVDLKLRVQPGYWEPVFGMNNLANRYMRFDHTNKTLYGEGSYFSANSSIKNHYNGSVWEHNSNYGLATAFEAQRFEWIKSPSNPLVFADEINSNLLWNGRIEYKFMGNDAEGVHYRAMMRTEGIAGIISQDTQHTSSISSTDPMQTYNFNFYYPYKLEFIVAPAMAPASAIYQDPNVRIPYPFQGKWEPQALGNHRLCANNASIRDVDDQENICYKTYPGAARIHYSLNDWTDTNWNATFVSNGTLRNPVTFAHYLGNNIDPSILSNVTNIFNWMTTATGDEKSQIHTLLADPFHYQGSQWYIDPLRLATPPIINSSYGASPAVIPKLVVNDDLDWEVTESNGVVSAIRNSGRLLTDSIRYMRSKDDTVLDMAMLRPLGTDDITQGRLQPQNANHPILGQSWMQSMVISNPQILSRMDSTQKHPYFTANMLDNSTIKVMRTANTPDERSDEIATLRGRVPGEHATWNLAYLQKGQLISLASGKQPETPPNAPFPVLKELNANRLQGNTSFFLTYGGQEIGSNLYFRQLDVHVGNLLDPQKDELFQSMYGNASVRFPAGAFSTPVDVTVRTVSLSDFNYQVFQGLDPVGAVIEVLPSYTFPAGNPALWPRVSIQISKETLLAKNQNPLEAKIYKPDFANKQIVPLEEQEIGFFLNNELKLSCFENSANCNSPDQWDMIRISGKTPTFSAFMVMDQVKAKQVQPAQDTLASDSLIFACTYLSDADTLWMGLVNGYLEYPYPCQGPGNVLLQLRNGQNVMAEHQTLATQNILWKGTMQDIPVHQLNYDSRFAVYGNNGKSFQMTGPVVLLDTVAPEILSTSLSVTDLSPQKLIQLAASVTDSMSGVAAIRVEFYWAGKLAETRLLAPNQTIVENFSLSKENQAECPGCKAQFFVTVEDKGHNFVRKELRTENIYPYPASMALWYPLAEGYGTHAKEALGSTLDLQLSMSRPWLYGQSLYFFAPGDVATSAKEWTGIGSAEAMSVEFKLRPGSLNKNENYALIAWNSTSPWVISVSNGTDLLFRYGNQTVSFPAVIGIAKSVSHYVISIKGNTVELFKDGSLSGTQNLGQVFTWNTKGKPVIGNYSNLPAMPGDLSNLRFYNKNLTAEDVYWLHAGFLNVSNSDFTVVRATGLTNRPGLIMDQSCDVPGQSYLRQESPLDTGMLHWSIAPGTGSYRLYVMSRGYVGQPSGVEVYLNGASLGIHNLPATGLWENNAVGTLTLSISSGAQTLSLRPVGNTGIAGLAIAAAEKGIPASLVRWNSEHWNSPAPMVDVWMQYNSYSDKTWIRPQFRLTNLTGQNLLDVRLRYYFRGEGMEAQPVAFYPQTSMHVYADAGDVFYAEMTLTEAIPAWGSAYWGNGPQIGLYRPEVYGPWYSEDDPSFDPNAVHGLHQTDRVALLGSDGRLLNTWSCFEAGGPAVLNTPKVHALASDQKLGSSQSSLINLMVENIGSQAIHGFESRYYFRANEGKQPILAVYNNPSATATLVNNGNGLYHVSFKYTNTILNPGEKTEFGAGAQFELHYPDWTADWNTDDDPSHSGLTAVLAPSDSLVVLDLNGNVLWGYIPTSAPFIATQGQQSSPNVIEPVDGGFAVTITAAGNYSLTEVNVAGVTQRTLFSGTWDVGTHFVSNNNVTPVRGNYLVLRRGSVIIDQILVK